MKNSKKNKLFYYFVKRIFDIIFSLFVLIILSPIFIIFASIIKLSSKGPAIYNWKVVGKNGVGFNSFKFRTMIQDADSLKKELLNKNEMKGPFFKMTNDPRITVFGRFLRKYSLDELPQFFSVLLGHMSVVGPRPPLQSEYKQFTEFEKSKMSVKPGITCLWQVEGRNSISESSHWIDKDLEYIEKQNFIMDLKIILQTILAVLKGSGK
jgi:lipopolysaccharide/colanic/teichoic acid biosynthesis glycosyltransferase